MTRMSLLGAAGAAVLALTTFAAPAVAMAQTSPVATTPDSRFERDRQAILAMAGDYEVRFAFHETTPFVEGYTPLEPKLSGGHEVVRVIEDTGERIVLQHILVAEHEGQAIVIKHWRQDWTYQPAEVLTYVGLNRWDLVEVPAEDRAGAWSQTVWQTDDSPRYGGVGRWTYENGVAEWESETQRPLARRDAIRTPPYDHYDAMNRHALTPFGWVHEQDNAKIDTLEDGTTATVVHEFGVNTYRRFDGFQVAAAETYWAATADYWAAVRAAWDEAIAAGDGVYVEEEAQAGSVTGPILMGMADQVARGDLTTEVAIERARALIAEATAQGG